MKHRNAYNNPNEKIALYIRIVFPLSLQLKKKIINTESKKQSNVKTAVDNPADIPTRIIIINNNRKLLLFIKTLYLIKPNPFKLIDITN